jgi:ankyrin repeat protein
MFERIFSKVMNIITFGWANEARIRTAGDAARSGDAKKLMQLLDTGTNPNSYIIPFGTLLQIATRHNNIDATLLLLNQGADPNKYVTGVELPIENAIHHDNVDIFRILIEYGADVSFNYGELLELASFRNRLNIAKEIFKRMDKEELRRMLEAGRNFHVTLREDILHKIGSGWAFYPASSMRPDLLTAVESVSTR